jgi:hypothetical protein
MVVSPITPFEILSAPHPEDVFGPDASRVTPAFRELAARWHPDRCGDDRVFIALVRMRAAAAEAIRAGRYGLRQQLAEPVEITTERRRYQATAILGAGEISTLYLAGYEASDGPQEAIVKVVRDPPRGSELMGEGDTLAALAAIDGELGCMLAPYLPEVIDTFRYRTGRVTRWALVYRRRPGFVSLAGVRAAYPDGVDAKDSAWMFRRLAMALGLVHAAGFVHRAIAARHLLIEPAAHGLVLAGWRAAGRTSERRERARDLADAARLIEGLTALGSIPDRLRAFYGYLASAPAGRLPGALDALDEYDELIERLWGPRRFRPFAIPNGEHNNQGSH